MADAGRPASAEAMLEERRRDIPAEFRGTSRASEALVRAAIARMHGDAPSAIEHARSAQNDQPDSRSALLEIGRAFDQAGMRDSAIAAYRRFVDEPHMYNLAVDATHLGIALLQLGQLYEAAGEPEAAARRYRTVVSLWTRADEALLPRVRGASARIARLNSFSDR